MVVNSFDCSRIGERERDLNVSRPVRHHSSREPLAQTSQLSEEAAVVRMYLQSLNPYAFDQIGRIDLSNYFSEGFVRARTDGHLNAVPGAQGNNFFCYFLSR